MEFWFAENVQYPGHCICTSQDRPLVDTGIELVGNQRVYLCERCVRTAAQLFGMVELTVAAKTEERALIAEGRVRDLETELADARPVLEAMAGAYRKYEVEN